MERLEEKTGVTDKLSKHMRESWEAGRFWLNYAARKSWAFDGMYWKYLDERFFGSRADSAVDVRHNERWKTRVDQLSEKEENAMEAFVKKTIAESNDGVLVDWDPEKAKVYLGKVLSVGDVDEVEDLTFALDRQVQFD